MPTDTPNDMPAASAEFTDADLELACQALLLHVTLKLPLKDKGQSCSELTRECPTFQESMRDALRRLSTVNEWGIRECRPSMLSS